MGGKRVLRVNFRIQNRSECGAGAGRNSQFSKIKGRFLSETTMNIRSRFCGTHGAELITRALTLYPRSSFRTCMIVAMSCRRRASPGF